MSAFGLAQNLGLERATAQAYIEAYFTRYPGVSKCMDEAGEKARRLGWVEAVFGRRLRWPEFQSGSPVCFKQKTAYEIGLGIPAEPLFRSHLFDLVIGKILTSRLSLSKHLAHNLGNLLLLGKIGVFHNRRNASSRLLLLISKHLILCIYLVFRILA